MNKILSRIGINTIDDFKDKDNTKIFDRKF